MQILVAGKECSQTLGSELEQSVQGREDCGLGARLLELEPILALRDAHDGADYSSKLHKELLLNHAVNLDQFRLAPGSSKLFAPLFGFVRRLCWKFLRYQHEWGTYQQNGVNLALVAQLQSLEENSRAQNAVLAQRVEMLERQLDLLTIQQRGVQ